MGGDEGIDAWAARQCAKALHVGKYEAAVHNMLRRIYWLTDPSNFVGDVVFDEVCPLALTSPPT